ncbi:serine threonine- kinase Nek1-like, partial [Brachionus plicatilis]
MKKVNQEKKVINSPKDIKHETEYSITELLDIIGIKGKQISKEEVLKDPSELLFEKPVENRRCWSEKTDLTPLNDFPLIENTIMPSPTIKIVSPRKEWDQPHLSVLNALDQANILTCKTVMFDKTVKEESNKSSIIKGDTYLIGDQVDSKNVKYTPTDSQLINEKPPDFVNNLTSNSFKATWEEALNKISPLKSEKLQMTKNMWLEMTLGKFDTKNTQLLRTCSVPDLLSKAINEDSDDDNEVVITKGKIGTLKNTTKKAQSLDDLNFENSERSSESDLSEKISYSDSTDLTQVRETMESFLFDSDEENDKKIKNIKPDDKETYNESDDLTEVIQSMQCYLSDEDDLTADKAEKKANNSRKRSDIPLDSLEISKKNLNELNDDNDCEIVSLNGESDGSDTEFEDEKPVFVNCSIEERRAILEKNLGQDEFKKNFRCLKALIQEEQSNDLEPNTSRESFKKFVQLFPNKEFFWYYEL